MKMTKGHQMVVDRKGGGYGFDAWFRVTPPDVQVFNPAFDVTPGELITAIITERGVLEPAPDYETILALSCHRSGGVHELRMEGLDFTPAEIRPRVAGDPAAVDESVYADETDDEA